MGNINIYYLIAITLFVIAFIILFPMLIHYKRKSEYLERKDYLNKILCKILMDTIQETTEKDLNKQQIEER